MRSRHLGQMVCLEGIFIKGSLVRSKVVKGVHYCPQTNNPTKDKEGNLSLICSKCILSKFQTVNVYSTSSL